MTDDDQTTDPKPAKQNEKKKNQTKRLPTVPPEEVPLAPEQKKPRWSAEIEIAFQKARTPYLEVVFRQRALGIKVKVPKQRVLYVLGRGYAPSHLDRIWKQSRQPRYAKYYDSDFPKPIDRNSHRLEWWLDDLLAYQAKRDAK